MNKTIKVIKIIDDKKIIINAGIADGISYNDRLEIYAEANSDIIDPDTGENLGKLKYIKACVRAQHIEEKYTICINNETDSVSLRDLLAVQNYLDATFTSPSSLNVNPKDISGGYSGIDKEICVGDLVQKASVN